MEGLKKLLIPLIQVNQVSIQNSGLQGLNLNNRRCNRRKG